MQIHLDLHENATRSQILDTLLEAMSEEERTSFDYIMNHAVVPDKHHHSIVEVRESIDALTVPEQVKKQKLRFMDAKWKKLTFMRWEMQTESAMLWLFALHFMFSSPKCYGNRHTARRGRN